MPPWQSMAHLHTFDSRSCDSSKGFARLNGASSSKPSRSRRKVRVARASWACRTTCRRQVLKVHIPPKDGTIWRLIQAGCDPTKLNQSLWTLAWQRWQLPCKLRASVQGVTSCRLRAILSFKRMPPSPPSPPSGCNSRMQPVEVGPPGVQLSPVASCPLSALPSCAQGWTDSTTGGIPSLRKKMQTKSSSTLFMSIF